jgi:chaperonin cofactor prefoldin
MTQREKILLHLSDKKNVSVELGEVQDLEKEISKYDSDKKALVGAFSQISNLKVKAKKDLAEHNKKNEALSKKADALYKKLADIGVDTQPVYSLRAKIVNIHSKGFDDDVLNYIYK